MKALFERMNELILQPGQVAVAWLGQSGLLIKAYPDRYLAVDPYLSDFCEEQLGLLFKRLVPPPIGPGELDELGLTAYAMTHHHGDHFDPPTVRGMKDLSFPFLAPPETIAGLAEIGVPRERCLRLTPGDEYTVGPFVLRSVFADHGELAPDAVGILIEVDGKRIYHVGDTAFHEAEFRKIAAESGGRFDLLIPPINGMYGNMKETEAADMAGILGAAKVLPAHFWMLPGNSGGDLKLFAERLARVAPDSELVLLGLGEMILLE